MIGLVLVTHGQLAGEFVTAMAHVVGAQDGIATIAIGPDDDMEERRADIAAAINRVDAGRGVIILTDLFGGTPSNLAISLMEPGRVEVIAGMNLPMLIRLGSARKSMKVVDAVAAAREAGRKYITVASEMLGGGGGVSDVVREVLITNKRGLHARASAKFVTLAATQPCEVAVAKIGSGDGGVTGTSIMGLMMLGAAKGDTIAISASGVGADVAVGALAELVEAKFGED